MDTGDDPKDKKGEFPIQGELEKGLEENVIEGLRKGCGMSSNGFTYKYVNARSVIKSYGVFDKLDPELLISGQAVAELERQSLNGFTYKYVNARSVIKNYGVFDQLDPELLIRGQAVAEGLNGFTYKYVNARSVIKNYGVFDQLDPELLIRGQAVAEGEPPKYMVAILDPPRSPPSAAKTVQLGLRIPIIVNALERESGQKHRHTVHVEPDEKVFVLRQLLANKCNVAYLPQHYTFAFKREVMKEDLSFREHGIVSMGGTKIDVVDFPVNFPPSLVE